MFILINYHANPDVKVSSITGAINLAAHKIVFSASDFISLSNIDNGSVLITSFKIFTATSSYK